MWIELGLSYQMEQKIERAFINRQPEARVPVARNLHRTLRDRSVSHCILVIAKVIATNPFIIAFMIRPSARLNPRK